MKRPLLVVVAAVLVVGFAAVAAGCSSSAADAPVDAPTRGDDVTAAASGEGRGGAGLPCDVAAILQARCQSCHGATPSFGAPKPLVTHADVAALGEGVLARVKDDTRPMPPSPNPRLTSAEIATLEAWIGRGAPPSSESCAAAPAPAGGPKPLSCKPDTILKPSKPFKLKAGGGADHYVCAGVDVELTKKRHVIGLAPRVDNKKILHHVLLFQSPTSVSSEPKPCEGFSSATWKLVAGWAPGGENLELPAEAGFPEEVGTTHWVLQLHYNDAGGAGADEEDQSGYELCTTEALRPHDAGILAFGSTRFSIPPRSTTTIACDYQLPSLVKTGTKVFSASPHMHRLGTAMSTERIRGGAGAPEVIFEQPVFDFATQSNYPVNAAMDPGDIIRTRCTWKNPEDRRVSFGEGTDDEMCFNFLSYYPAIPDVNVLGFPLSTWAVPSLLASCKAE